MKNPFEVLEARLSNLENLILDLKHQPKDSSMPDEKLLTIEQAADFLSLTKPTIYNMVSRGELPSMKRSKRLYFSREDLISYVKQGRRKTNDEIAADADDYIIKRKRR